MSFKKLFFPFFFILFLILFSFQASAIVINEILPNPEEFSDAEWLELYSDSTMNLSGYKLDTTGQIYNFGNVNINDYLVIAKNKTSFLSLWPNVSQEKVIEWQGMGLNNAGEPISLLNNNITIDATTYPSFSSRQGKSWARLENQTFTICNLPSPAERNNCSQQTNQTNQTWQNESTIKITDYPDDADFGDSIDIDIKLYRGNTAKYAVYIYIENDEGTDVSDKETLHLDDKYTNYTETVTLELKCKNEEGTYTIVAEGLDEKDTEEIEINKCSEYENQNEESEDNETQASEGTTIGDFTYSLTIPNTIYIGKEIPVNVRIKNDGNEAQDFYVWSYVYNGPKCYSCINDDREENKKSIKINAGSSEEISLQDIVQEAEPGSYKLKIKILQSNLKTPKEFSYDVMIEGNSNSPQQIKETIKTIQSTQSTTPITGAVIESESFSLNKAMPYFLATVSLLLTIYIIVKKV